MNAFGRKSTWLSFLCSCISITIPEKTVWCLAIRLSARGDVRLELSNEEVRLGFINAKVDSPQLAP